MQTKNKAREREEHKAAEIVATDTFKSDDVIPVICTEAIVMLVDTNLRLIAGIDNRVDAADTFCNVLCSTSLQKTAAADETASQLKSLHQSEHT